MKERVATSLRHLLVREDWVYLLSLLLPLFVYNVGLKIIRILTQLSVPGPVGFADQLRSDVLFNLGYAALWIGAFAVFRRGVPRWATLALFHLSALLVVVLTTSTHFFYKSTGSTLDYSFIMLSLSSFGETSKIIAAETSAFHWVLLGAVLLYLVAGPVIVTRLFGNRWRLPLRTSGQRLTAPLVMCCVALALGVLSALPSATGASNNFSRDALINLALTELNKPDFEQQIRTNLVAGTPPADTSLKQTPQTRQHNVALVFLESTRARSTTPYNEDLKTTPFLDELAGKSLVAENAYAVVPHTSKALVAATCGVAPPLDTRNTEAKPNAIPAQCLPDLLEEQGYNTAFFQSATEEFERRAQLVENFGYEDFFPIEEMDKKGFEEANYFGYEDDIMLEPSREWLEENKNQPFLTSYLTVTPHHDYTVPDRYGKKKFAEDEELNRYLNTVRYQDFFLKNLFDQYKELGVYDNTVFVIFGDHGEGFGEHGARQHDNVIYNEGLRIPFLIHAPNRYKGGERMEPPVNKLDVLPTVMDLLGYEVTGGTYPGTSVLNAPTGRTLMASCYQENRCLASIEGSEKYIYYYGNKDAEFYDLSSDPRERENIADEQSPEKLEKQRDALLTWQIQTNSSYEKRLYGEGPKE
ncbi:MAG: sulfatase-like hydrolase/transferase [Actinomycetota bacterium]|nr:sulfatase-like hydrolase/transferase [Actinomycetota bacterium]HZY64422.1 sulfatase-like hydrolase/transferase [Rubrobacteraceae bacterium]